MNKSTYKSTNKSSYTPIEQTLEAEKNSGDYFKDLLRYRELFFFMAWRDILVRYKQAFFGIAWAIVRPLLNMALFTLIFGKIAHLSSGSTPYSLFVLAGMLPWQLVSSVAFDATHSLINNVNLVTKIYFPRIILPTSLILVNLVDFAINLALLAILMVYMGSYSFLALLSLPLVLALVLIFCVGVSLWLSAITVQYRDFRFIVQFLVQFGVFASPVGYGSYIITGVWKWVFFLNPMVGIIDSFRYAFFGIIHPDILASISISAILSILLFTTGLRYFRKMELIFADGI